MTTANVPSLRTPEGLRAWRAARGISQRQLADLLEVAWKGTLSRYENGHQAIPRVIELALIGLDQELANVLPPSREWTPADDLILELCREAGDDVTNAYAVVDGFRANPHPDDIQSAADGDLRALIRLRKACGLPTFK